MLQKKRALLFSRFTESQLVAGAIDVLFFKRARGHAHEFRAAEEIVLGQVDEARLIATVDAATLAGEAEAVHILRGCQIAV